MKPCPSCGRALPEINRYCTDCGAALESHIPAAAAPTKISVGDRATELEHSLRHGDGAGGLLLMPPWESPPSQPAAFLGFHFILSPPQPDAIVSRLLLTIELTTTAIAGLYLSFLFRSR